MEENRAFAIPNVTFNFGAVSIHYTMAGMETMLNSNKALPILECLMTEEEMRRVLR